jgi:hypothetical protein
MVPESLRVVSERSSIGGVDEGDRRGVDRLTIQDAARRLGISEGAVRKRVARGTLTHDKEDDGRVYVYLDTGGIRGVDGGQDEGVSPNSNALISRLESEVAFLRDQVQRQQEVIAQQAMTMRQLTAASSQEPPEEAETIEEEPEGAEPTSYAVEVHESSQGATEAAEAADEQQGRGEPYSDAPGPQEGARRPWWRKLIGR